MFDTPENANWGLGPVFGMILIIAIVTSTIWFPIVVSKLRNIVKSRSVVELFYHLGLSHTDDLTK